MGQKCRVMPSPTKVISLYSLLIRSPWENHADSGAWILSESRKNRSPVRLRRWWPDQRDVCRSWHCLARRYTEKRDHCLERAEEISSGREMRLTQGPRRALRDDTVRQRSRQKGRASEINFRNRHHRFGERRPSTVKYTACLEMPYAVLPLALHSTL